MNIDNHIIEKIEELEAFLHLVESGALGLEGVEHVLGLGNGQIREVEEGPLASLVVMEEIREG